MLAADIQRWNSLVQRCSKVQTLLAQKLEFSGQDEKQGKCSQVYDQSYQPGFTTRMNGDASEVLVNLYGRRLQTDTRRQS